MSKILIIEDEEPIRRVLVRILSEEDSKFEIHEASDGKKGLDSISKESFDLVLCDIKMPKIDGMELLQRTRKQNASLPFIMLTGHGNIETAVESMKLGAYDFIPKPPDLNRLITSVRNALEKKELVIENKILIVLPEADSLLNSFIDFGSIFLLTKLLIKISLTCFAFKSSSVCTIKKSFSMSILEIEPLKSYL